MMVDIVIARSAFRATRHSSSGVNRSGVAGLLRCARNDSQILDICQ